jgi:hypothetical protein
MSQPEPQKTDQEQEQQLPPIGQVVADMVDEAIAARPARDAESRANFERAGQKEKS